MCHHIGGSYRYSEVTLEFEWLSITEGRKRRKGVLHIKEAGVLKYEYTIAVDGQPVSNDPKINEAYVRAPFPGASVRVVGCGLEEETLAASAVGGAPTLNKYISYKVQVSTPKIETLIECTRRFRDFESLHRLIKSAYCGHLASNVPSLPSKAVWRTLTTAYQAFDDPQLLEERRTEFELYLQRLLALPKAGHNPDLLRFLGLI